eukprot:364779-Chlamydomonas_euryale.AAC.28
MEEARHQWGAAESPNLLFLDTAAKSTCHVSCHAINPVMPAARGLTPWRPGFTDADPARAVRPGAAAPSSLALSVGGRGWSARLDVGRGTAGDGLRWGAPQRARRETAEPQQAG